MTGPVAGVTLDLDDTVFPQEEWLAGAWVAVADRGADLGLDRAALLRRWPGAPQGRTRGGIIDRALAASGVPPEAEAESASWSRPSPGMPRPG